MIKIQNFDAVIFDMDGVLIDSEPLWKIAMEETFTEIGMKVTKKDFQKTVGLRIDEVISYWFNCFEIKHISKKEAENKIINKMIVLIKENGFPLSGVVDTLAFLNQEGKKIGLATSSFSILMNTVIETLNLSEYFHVLHSAENEKYGKPHPAVYLTVADKLGVEPTKCLVIEDSLNGIISGKAARMTVVCIPEKTHHPEPRLSLADFQFEDMNEFLKLINI